MWKDRKQEAKHQERGNGLIYYYVLLLVVVVVIVIVLDWLH